GDRSRGRDRGARPDRRTGAGVVTTASSAAPPDAAREQGVAPPASGTDGLMLSARQFGTVIGLVVLCAVLWVLTPHFLTVSNLLNVTEQTSINAVVAVGMTFVILSGGIDLSVGSIVALSGVVLGTALQSGQALYVAVPLAL